MFLEAHAILPPTAGLAADHLGAALSMDACPGVSGTMPFRAELQQLFHCRGAEIRRLPRHAARNVADRPLQSLEPRRLRPALAAAAQRKADQLADKLLEIHAAVHRRLGQKASGGEAGDGVDF